MRLFTRLRAHRRTVASVASVSVISVAVATMAILAQGVTTADVDLNDGGVWVTKPQALQLGHLNYPSQVLDSGLKAASNDFDVLQSGESVALEDRANGTLSLVDPALTVLDGEAVLPADYDVALGSGTVAILDRGTGALFALTPGQLDGFDPATAEPTLVLGVDPGEDTEKSAEPTAGGGEGTSEGDADSDADEPPTSAAPSEAGRDGVVAVGADGSVFAVSPAERTVTTVPVEANGSFGRPSVADLGSVPAAATLSLAAVGTRPVVFDASTGTVYRPGGGTTVVPGAKDGVLQQSGVASSAVLISTADALISQPVDGGAAAVSPADASGSPIAPVRVGTCSYAAWATSGSYVRDCDDDVDDSSRRIDGLDPSSSLVFRVNRGVVVINDLDTGSVWLVNQDMKKVDNWDDLTPPPGETDDETDENSTEETLENTLPERTEENTPPTAEDDAFGVRPGRSTVLPVLDNDNDPDGDVLTASVEGSQPGIGTVEPIYSGGSMQIAVPGDATGAAAFTYLVDDGRGGTDTATVTLTVKAPGTNEEPRETRRTVRQVEQGAEIVTNVLTDWIDPDGDDLFLRSASATSDDEVQFRADGAVTFTASGLAAGRKEVVLLISDGTTDVEGTLVVDVRERGTAKPVANADHETTVVGKPVTIAPLLNDLSPSGAPLRLARVDETEGGRIAADYTSGVFTFTADAPDDYYVQYLATDGPNTAIGIVRVTVEDPTSAERPPVAVRDVGLLPQGREVLVDVLANDVDPASGVLVVQSVDLARADGLTVAVLDHNVLRITDQPGITEPVTIGYTISNGVATASGEVLVLPVPAPTDIEPPVAVDDTVSVRAGDIATIPVLANDYHPSGDAITLSPDLVEPLVDPADGDVFVSENTLRFKAEPLAVGAGAKTVYATYEVVDTLGQRDGGYVTIQILPVDAESNSPPRPETVTARALAGSSIRVPIPLDGIDPDGDSVELVGQASAPTLGRITATGAGWIDYEASPDAAGTDTFTYTVRDRLGLTATGTVLVGVAPKGQINQKPYAVKDSAVVRPERTVAVAVLENDSDPDGDRIGLVADGLVVPDGLEAEVVDDRVVVRTSATTGDFTLQYTVADALGATAVSTLLITVSPDAKLETPIARDDLVTSAEVVDRTSVDVAVLENDEDPDGVPSELQVAVDGAGPGAATVSAAGVVTVPLLADAQILTYTVTDADGLAGSAFILVPGIDAVVPTMIDGAGSITVKSGESATIVLGDHVRVGRGASARLTEEALVYATHSDGSPLVRDATTMVYTPAPGYSGPDALTFEVTDGTGPDDPEGTKATLSIQITVLPPDNVAPTFAGGSLEVVPGETAARLDLRSLAADENEGDLARLTFALAGAVPEGFTAAVDGGALTVAAAATTPKGTALTLPITVSDGIAEPVAGSVEVTVTTSARPLPRAVDDVFPKADQGEPLSVDALSNDFNPFPETPLTIVQATVESGDGTVAVEGGKLVVTPGPDMVGQLTVVYRIQDATADVDREAQGSVRVTVQGRPTAPGRASVTEVRDRTVVLNWASPRNNGSEITGYQVTANDGTTTACASTSCTITGLTNDVTYTFRVTATNAVGTSEPSPESAPARPDVRPAAPGRPTGVFGDESITFSWPAAESAGSPVTGYTLELSPAPTRGPVQQETGGTSYTWSGLSNGTQYTVKVRATNKAPEPSEWSAESAAVVPARAPDAPAAPTASRVDTALGGQIHVVWEAPNANGDAVSSYRVSVYKGSGLAKQVELAAGPAETLQQTIDKLDVDGDYTFTVAAKNKAGWSAEGKRSAAKRPYGAPDAMGAVTLSRNASGYSDRELAVAFEAPDFNGDAARYIVRSSSGETLATNLDWGSGSVSNTLTRLVNGTDYAIQVQACNAAGCGAWSPSSETARPFGPLLQFTIEKVLKPGGTGTWTWDFERILNGQTFAGAGATGDYTNPSLGKSGSVDITGMYYTSKRVKVDMYTAEGYSTSDAATLDGGPNPARGVTVRRGAEHVGTSNCRSGGGCYFLDGEIRGFVPNANVTVGCNYVLNGSPSEWKSFTIQLDGNGNGSWTGSCFVGPDASNSWTPPYFATVRDSHAVTESNKDVRW